VLYTWNPSPAARWAEEQDVGTLLQPGIARRQRHDLGFRDHWHGLEVECGECLAGGQTRLGEMALHAAATAVGHFVLGQRCQEAGCRPAFLVGLLGKLGPPQFDSGQPQLAQQEFNPRGINGVGCRHATTSWLEVVSTL
jgi:hypothetical protein